MKTIICFICAIILSVLSFFANAQSMTTDGPYCQQLVGRGSNSIRLSIEVFGGDINSIPIKNPDSIRISITRAYADNVQENPTFDDSREFKIINPTSGLPAGMPPIKAGTAGIKIRNLSNGQAATFTKDHILLQGVWYNNQGYLQFYELPYKLGQSNATLTENYLPAFPLDYEVMQCPSTTAIITSATNLQSLCIGSEVTLNAEGFSGSGDYVWERSDSPDGPWEIIPNQNGSSITIVSNNGNEYFKASQGNEEADPIMITSIPCCQYTDSKKELWKEDFGTVAPGQRACNPYVKNHQCRSTPNTEIPDGSYAVVSNSNDALDPTNPYFWARDKKDHTGNENGGFLVINIGAPTQIYEQKIQANFCKNQWYTFSLFASNISQQSGHQAAEFLFEIVSPDGKVLGHGETGPIKDWEMEDWTQYGISFNSGNYDSFTIKLYSVAGNANGNDVALDDMSISICSPQINLYADIDAGLTDATVDCGSDLTLAITGSDEYLYSIYSHPYVLWQKSTDGGATWTDMEGSGEMVTTMPITKDDPTITDYYRCILAGSEDLAKEAATTGTLEGDCNVFSITNMITVDCKKVCKVSIKVSDEDICEGDEVTLEATPAYYDSYEWTGPGISDKYSRIQTVKIDKESTYTVKAAGAGCYNIEPATVVLTPYKRPVVNLQSSEIEICEGESITLTASATEADKYELYTNGTISSTQAEAEWQTTPQKGVSDYKVIAYNHGCAGTSDEVQVTTHETIQIEVSPNEATVCKGSEVQITATEISGDPTRFFWNGTEAPNPYIFTAINDKTIEVYAENDYCTSETVKSNIYVKEAVKITMSEVNDICLGENINITATISGDYNEITWFESANGSEFVQIPGKIENTLNITPQKSGITIYKINVSADECPNTSSTVELFVHEPIVIEVSPETATVCQGSEVELTASVIKGNPTLFFWNGTEAPNPYKFTANNNQTIEVYAANNYCTSETVESNISVKESIKITLSEVDDICLGESISIKATISGDYNEITWFESVDGGDFTLIPGENGNTLNITPAKSGNIVYKINVSADECPNISNTTGLLVHEPIVIEVSPATDTVCKGSEVELTASVIKGNPTLFFWNGTEAPNPYKFTANNDQTIEVYAQNDVCSSLPVTAAISVDEPVSVSLPALDDICLGEDLSITASVSGDFSEIQWSESIDGGAFAQIPNENGSSLDITPQQSGNTTYKIDVLADACPGASASTDLLVNEPVIIKVLPENATVCKNSEVLLTASVIAGNPTRFFWNGMEAPNPYTFTAINDQTIEVYAQNDVCSSLPVTAAISVDEPVSVSLPALDDICLGEDLSITASVSGDFSEIQWSESIDGGVFAQIPNENGSSLDITPQQSGNTTYKIDVLADACPGASASTDLLVNEPVIIKVQPENATVCKNSEVQLTASVIAGNPTSFFWNGIEAPNPYTFTALDDQTIEVYAQNDVCSSQPVTAAISVDEPVSVSLPALDDICLGEDLSITASVSGDFSEIQWSESIDGGSFAQIPNENGNTLDITPQQSGNTTYKIDVLADACPGASASTHLLVNEPVIITVQPENATVCKNSEVLLTASVIAGNPTSFFWNGIEAPNPYTFTALDDQTIEVYAQNDVCSSLPVTAAISVDEPVSVSLPALDDICLGEDLSITASVSGDFSEIQWSESIDGGVFAQIPNENGSSLDITPQQSGNTTYKIDVLASVCEPAQDITHIVVNSVPEILQISDNVASEGIVSIIINNGTPPYSIFLNGEYYGTNPNLSNLDLNTHYDMEITDVNGCSVYGEFSTPKLPIEIPIFFTPNGDNLNDVWEIKNIDIYPDAVIEIYDRHSRRLRVYSGKDDGWDGTYNGHDMPMDDYWYIITIPGESRRFSGHFTLKR